MNIGSNEADSRMGGISDNSSGSELCHWRSQRWLSVNHSVLSEENYLTRR